MTLCEADSVESEDILAVDLAVAVKSITGGGTAATGTTTTAAAAGGDPSSPIEPPRGAIYCTQSSSSVDPNRLPSTGFAVLPLSLPPFHSARQQLVKLAPPAFNPVFATSADGSSWGGGLRHRT